MSKVLFAWGLGLLQLADHGWIDLPPRPQRHVFQQQPVCVKCGRRGDDEETCPGPTEPFEVQIETQATTIKRLRRQRDAAEKNLTELEQAFRELQLAARDHVSTYAKLGVEAEQQRQHTLGVLRQKLGATH